MPMPSKTIDKKLLSLVTSNLLLAGSILFIVMLGGVLMAVRNQQASIERSTRANLVEKGTILIVNNSQALRGLVMDHAFSAIQELLGAAVKEDPDVVYAIFMDSKRLPWAVCRRDKSNTVQTPATPLDDSLSLWANRNVQAGFTEIKRKDGTIIEFAAPVIVEGERLGTIRYGLSTKRMVDAVQSQTQALYGWAPVFGQGILAIIAVTLFTGSLRARQQAHAITRPIAELVLAASRITQGNYNQQVQADSDDEIAELARTFETMRLTMKNYTENLENMVAERTRQLEAAQKELVNRAHKAGMADIASGALHNIGNILNSVKTSLEIMGDIFERIPLKGLENANNLLRENLATIDEFIAKDPRGKKLMMYYTKLEGPFHETVGELKKNLVELKEKTEVIANVIAEQQSYAGMGGLTEEADLAEIIDNALAMQSESIERHEITVEKNYGPMPRITVQKVKLVNILVNLVKNAKDAMTGMEPGKKKIRIAIELNDGNAFVRVTDTGCGIPSENLKLVFTHGFTTKAEGHGFGLHSCANYMTEMGGEMWAESDGEGKGATFVLRLPVTPAPQGPRGAATGVSS
jgi:signal transduction histidine kinase